MEKPAAVMPPLFMSANWFSEKQMIELFVAGLQQGVRGFDTAREYGTEAMVGRALRKALQLTGLRRDDIFLQTRISNEEIIKGHVYDEVCHSIKKLGTDYVDCFMFHWPTPDYWIPAWKQLEVVYEKYDLVHSIGMCNCRKRHLLQMEKECALMPHVLQIEIQPFWQANDVVDYCQTHNIAVQAFSPLCKMIEPIRSNDILERIASAHGVSIPQVILKWHVQRGVSPISLTSKVSRVKENFNLSGFELNDVDLKEIGTLDCGYKYHLESATCVGY